MEEESWLSLKAVLREREAENSTSVPVTKITTKSRKDIQIQKKLLLTTMMSFTHAPNTAMKTLLKMDDLQQDIFVIVSLFFNSDCDCARKRHIRRKLQRLKVQM